MNKKGTFLKALTLGVILMAASGLWVCYADPSTESAENTGPGIALRTAAPVYTGPIEEGDLEELTPEDFERFGSESANPVEQYQQYREMLGQPSPGMMVPYRMRIVDRDLTLEDFFGFNVPAEVSQARYDGYLDMNPETADGHTIHYVYVYHEPLDREEPESSEDENEFK